MGQVADLLAEKRADILAAAARYGATRVRVFGSVARGEDGPDSDVDFLVTMEDGRSLLDMIGFALDVEELLGRKVDVLSEGGIHPRIRGSVLSEARPL